MSSAVNPGSVGLPGSVDLIEWHWSVEEGNSSAVDGNKELGG